MPTQEIVPGLHRVAGFANTYLLEGRDGLTLIDTNMPNKAKTVLDALAGLKRAPGEIRNIVVTHAHIDHIGSLAALKAATGAAIWAHGADVPIIEQGGPFRPFTAFPNALFRTLIKLFANPDARVEPAPVDHRVADGEVLPLAGGLRAIHLPGHCAGQIALLWESRRVLFTGDACMNLFKLGPPLAYEDAALGRDSLKKLGTFDYDVACFGHGKPIVGEAAGRMRMAFGG